MTPGQLLTAWTNCRDTRKAYELLKQFQLEAYKSGMMKAAEIAKFSFSGPPPDIRILTFCNNLKEIPK
jgi:hypothetical protein